MAVDDGITHDAAPGVAAADLVAPPADPVVDLRIAPVPDPVADPERVAAVAATGLTSSRDDVLDGYCRLVRRVLGVPVALVSLVDADRQLLPGVVGLGGWAEELRETPLSHAMCRTAVRTGEVLVVPDTRLDPALCGQPAVTELGFVAYLGIPLMSADGQVLGALCAIDRQPRQWTDDDRATLVDLAGAVSSELRLRVANSQARRLLAAAAQSSARASLVAAISELLTGRLDEEDGLAELARAVVPLLADWAVVDALYGDRLVRIEVAHRDLDLPAAMRRRELPEIASATTPLARVLRGLEPLVRLTAADLPTVGVADELGATEAELFGQLGASHALVLGLVARGRVLGAMTLARTGAWGFSPEEEQTAVDVARRAAVAVDNARLYAQQRGAAETLQAGLLTRLPQLRGAQLAGRYIPASEAAEVGGDWYDAFRLDAGGVALVIGDVVGHDLAAAALMGQLRNLLRAVAVERGGEPAAALTRLDELLVALELDVMATVAVAGVRRDDDGVHVRWSAAGHPPPVLVGPDGTAELLAGSGDVLLGVDATLSRTAGELALAPGSTLLLYTDGLVEQRDVAIDERLERLRTVAADRAGLDLEAYLDAVVRDMVGGAHDDDVALLAFRLE